MRSLDSINTPSPNFDERGAAVDMVVLHYTGMPTGEEALARLRDGASKVSSHYLVEEDGRIFRLVDESMRAWHAGVSSWRGETGVNARSIGIEIVNPGHEWGYRAFPDVQIESVVALLKDIVGRRNIPANRVLGHSDVAPQRKEDPGELFPWKRLAEEGLAIGPYEGAPDTSAIYEDAFTLLRAVGYDAPDRNHVAALLAFQRRFCPAALGQGFSPLTKGALKWAAAAMN
jgi:N-acetylmuramoyl-L-alanine amidase